MAAPKQFTDEQLRRYRRVFDLFDIDKNGVIDSREMASMAKVMGYQMDKTQVQSMLSRFDMDKNSVLTFEEFVQAMPGKDGPTHQPRKVAFQPQPSQRKEFEEYRKKFLEFDRDGNGYVTADEAAVILARDLCFPQEKTRALLNTFDVNKDGKLSYEEFIGFYMKFKVKKQSVDNAFRQFDREGKGFVTVDDARRILLNFGFTDQEIVALVKANDTNQDGILQFDEFVHFWNV
jgi:Ca2+-binding EF-hand superfamily protein